MVSVFYFGLVYGWCVASLGLVPVAMPTLIFLGLIQIGQSSKLITQPPRNIIKHTSLLSLRIDDSLLINRLTLLSSGVGGWCMGGWTRWVLKSDEGGISLSDTIENFICPHCPFLLACSTNDFIYEWLLNFFRYSLRNSYINDHSFIAVWHSPYGERKDCPPLNSPLTYRPKAAIRTA